VGDLTESEEKDLRVKLKAAREFLYPTKSRKCHADPDQTKLLLDEVDRCHRLLEFIDRKLRGAICFTGEGFGTEQSLGVIVAEAAEARLRFSMKDMELPKSITCEKPSTASGARPMTVSSEGVHLPHKATHVRK
jgi:hypothetical protein